VLSTQHRFEHLQAAICQRCRNNQTAPPAPSRIDRPMLRYEPGVVGAMLAPDPCAGFLLRYLSEANSDFGRGHDET